MSSSPCDAVKVEDIPPAASDPSASDGFDLLSGLASTSTGGSAVDLDLMGDGGASGAMDDLFQLGKALHPSRPRCHSHQRCI